MAKINYIHNNFTSGELSPLIYMRTELAQYRNGLKEAFNVLPIVEGGIRRRGGTKLVLTATGAVRILPFIVSHAQTYFLVLKPNQIDIYKADGLFIKSVSTPYTATDIKELTYYQNRYSFYLAHGNHPLSWLRCSKDLTNWEFDKIGFAVPPLEETDSPSVAVKPSEKAAGKKVSLVASIYETYDNTKRYLKDAVCWFVIDGTKYYFKARKVTQGNTPTLGHTNVEGYFPDENWDTVTVTNANAFTANDVNKFMFINEGIVRIDQFISTSELRGEILSKLNSDVEAIADSWSFKQDIFSTDQGYPRSVSMFQQRLVLGGTKNYPNYIWFSRVGDELNFLPTTVDGDAFTVSASSDLLTNVLHLTQSRGVVVFTGGSELAINAQNAITPTNANIIEHTSYGSTENIKPIKVGSEIIFCQRGSERLRTLVYDYSQDGLVSNELTVLASHIAEEHGGFKDMCYQQEPDSVIWFVMNDGTLATLTLNREQSVTSWSRHNIGGQVLSILSLPSVTGSDKLYFLVNRNGTVQVEQLDDSLYLDTAKSVNVENGIATDPLITALGNELSAYYKNGDTIYSIPITKTEGNTITIDCDDTVNSIYIGRKFTSKISLFAPELQQTPTTSSTALFKINYINVYFYKSLNPKINGQMIELKQFTENLFESPKAFTGNKRIEMNGWNTYDNFKLEISQDEPLPFHVSALVMEHNFNER
ncbi:hypothetical protein V6C59_17580 [Acinetobacter bereziniae]|uniref:phage nozzle protein n=1 Tax=Acinetobacter bereziniae TaxID=106648 RepID=UPI002FDB5A0A